METIDSAVMRDFNMRNAFLFALLDDLPCLMIQCINVYYLGTIHSLWYLIAPTLSFVSYTLNVTKVIY